MDVFTDGVFWKELFGRQAAQKTKDAQGQPFVPDLLFLLEDKVRTLPRRLQGLDGRQKAFKDCPDIRTLVVHNRRNELPGPLAGEILPPHRRRAAEATCGVKDTDPQYSDEIEQASRWLQL